MRGRRSDDDTPREWPPAQPEPRLVVRRPPLGFQEPVSASDHPKVKVARVWHSTIVTTFAVTVIGVLAALQEWPPEVTLPALGAATGLWAFGALKR